MPSNYDAIRRENERKYGTDIQRIGGMLLADRYDDRTHFIYEVLQNTEDALKKRNDGGGPGAINFALTDDSLAISHYGKPFDEADVRGVCGIAESTKEELTNIGRFGIGFKSVYAFTDSPEIHSGDEHFVIDSFVWPRSVNERALSPEETQIIIPFKRLDDGRPPMSEVYQGLQRLRPRTLLFLRQITEIIWSVNGVVAGGYRRQDLEQLTGEARKVRVIDTDGSAEDWIVFSREVFDQDKSAGYIELAFALEPESEAGQQQAVQPLNDPPLVVFFPTVLSTHLGFIVQGPYRTTPSRDNIPQNDPWNRQLVADTSQLLVDALKELRELGLLDVSAIETLPFREGRRFAPMFQAVKDALLNEPLLPAHNGGHIAGKNAKLSRTSKLRELISPEQLAALFPEEGNCEWLSGDITPAQAPVLHKYLREDLAITEVTAASLVTRLTKEFLEAQTDEWVQQLYEFLNERKGVLRGRPSLPPLVRLENGAHTVPFDGDVPQAYLPGEAHTGFPIVKPSVCHSREALEFLQGLGLRKTDPGDFVIKNILPKYGDDPVLISEEVYRADLAQAIAAFASAASDQKQRERLTDEIGKVKFTIAVDAATNARQFVRPSEAYWPTPNLKALFAGIPGVLLVDDTLFTQRERGEVYNLLRAAETDDHLALLQVPPALSNEQKHELRLKHSDGRVSHETGVADYTLRGLSNILAEMAAMPFEQASERARLLWDALGEFQSYRRDSAFNGRYSWYYYRERHAEFPAYFVELLSNVEWVPDRNRRELQSPREVTFADTGWDANPSLAEKIGFPPSDVDELAEKVGIEAAALLLLRERGITTEAQVMEAFGITGDTPESIIVETPATNSVDPGAVQRASASSASGGSASLPVGSPQSAAGSQSTVRRQFFTYVKVDAAEPNPDPDGLTYQQRMSLEAQAIKLIRAKEPNLQEAPTGNHGFDLYETGPDGNIVRWIELKAMSGTLDGRDLPISSTQFRFAQDKGEAFWLYIVENAGSPAQHNIIRIKDPAGKARNFVFDRGWRSLAEEPA